MQLTDHALIGEAAKIPKSKPGPVLSFSPVILRTPNRIVDLQLRVSAPPIGEALPIIILSHGHGPSNHLPSLDGYAPVAEFWAGHGFAVIQPTHLNSNTLGITVDGSNLLDVFLESRVRDMSQILDRLDEVEAAVPLLKGRLNRDKVVVVGHSLGAFTASVLLGATNTDPRDGKKTDLADRRIKADVIIGGSGTGRNTLTEAGKKILPFYDPDFSAMRAPALVVWGDEDATAYAVGGPEWHAGPYTLAPGPKDSFMVKGGKHGFGGISSWDAAETQDESPERLETVRRVTLAYMRSQLYEGDTTWAEASKALGGLENLGKMESK